MPAEDITAVRMYVRQWGKRVVEKVDWEIQADV
jgi:hypothetical protein